MKFYSLSILAIILIFITCKASAQELVWNLGLNYRFDNREYKDVAIANSQTLYGARMTPEIGLGWNGNNSLMLGVDLMSDFGHKTFFTDPDMLLYYNYNSEKIKVAAGVFPRTKMVGEYSYAFFSDSLRFYDANIDGLLIQYVGKNGYFEFGCDWNSMYSADKREKFMLFSAGRIRQGVTYVGYSFDMYHHAGSYTLGGVVDNVLVSPYIGFDFAQKLNFQELTVQGAWLQAFQNDREYVGEYVKPNGAQIDLKMKKWGFGVYNSLYLGDNLMPYYDSPYEDENGAPYAYNLYPGDSFYRTTSGVYNRLELFWEPKLRGALKARIASVHHYDGNKWGWQQTVSLSIMLNSKMFGRSRATGRTLSYID